MTEAQKTLPYPTEIATLPVETLHVRVLGGGALPEGAETGDEVEVAEGEMVQVGSAHTNDLVLLDDTVSRFHLGLSRRDHGIFVEDYGSTNGTFAHGMQIERAIVPAGTALRLGRVHIRVEAGRDSEVELLAGNSLGSLKGRAVSMRRLFGSVRRAGASDVSVLLVGESGTGKELIARRLHEESTRAGRPFLVVDCASLAPTLVASELFGHEKGAFTGADRRHEGAFERANGGTVVLDEIGELPAQLQPTLLGVLERKRIRRLGGRDEIPIDVRVIAATHRDLRSEVNQGRFRLDLYYRIAVVRLAVPPLRERPEDIPLLVEHFLREMGETADINDVVPPQTMAQLIRHDWPGNVRELRNHVQATLAMGESPELEPLIHRDSSIPPTGPQIALEPLLHLSYKEARGALLQQFELHFITRALERADGNVTQAARDCGMDRSYLWELVRRHDLRGGR